MFRWSAQSWFYNCSKPTKKEERDRSSWLAKILSNHEERIVAELDVQKVLSYLVYERVFSLEEFKDILSQECCKKQAASFLEQLSSKGPAAFSAFCSVLERTSPHLLIPILLDYQGVLNRSFPDLPFENLKLRAVSEMDIHDTSETSDLEGNPLAEDQANHSFKKCREGMTNLEPELVQCPFHHLIPLHILDPNLIPQARGGMRPPRTTNCSQTCQKKTFEDNLTWNQENRPPTQSCKNSHRFEKPR